MIQLLPGGFLKAVEDDTSPQLSGDLDGQSLYDLVNMVDGTFSGTGAFGRVGIGTASPDRNSEIVDDTNPQLRLTHTEGSVYTDFLTMSTGKLQIIPVGGGSQWVFIIGDEVRFAMGSDPLTDAPTAFMYEKEEDHFQVIPGGARHIYYFEDSSEGENKNFRIYGHPTGGSLNYAQLKINNSSDFGMSTSLAGSHIVLNPKANVGVGAITPTAKFDIDSDILRLRTSKTPASAGAAGNAGDICWDASYIYVCVATDTWERAALSSW